MEYITFKNKLSIKKKQEHNLEQQKSAANFDRLQEIFYKKYNNLSLNKMRIPIRVNLKSVNDKTLTEEDDNFYRSNGSYLKTSQDSRSEIKTPSEAETTKNKRNSLKDLAKPFGQHRKREPQKFAFAGRLWNQIPAENWKLLNATEYSDEIKLENKIANVHLSEEDENKYTNILNRNIRKRRRPSSELGGSRLNKTSQGYTDVDSFFQKHVSSQVTLNHENKNKPEDFSR